MEDEEEALVCSCSRWRDCAHGATAELFLKERLRQAFRSQHDNPSSLILTVVDRSGAIRKDWRAKRQRRR